jgi:hypothetical protein
MPAKCRFSRPLLPVVVTTTGAAGSYTFDVSRLLKFPLRGRAQPARPGSLKALTEGAESAAIFPRSS